MFIAVIGTRSAGKSTVQDYLVRTKGFQPVRLVLDGDERREPSSEAASVFSAETDESMMLDTAEDHTSQRRSFLSLASPVSSSFPLGQLGLPSLNSSQKPLRFSSLSKLLSHVTQNWRTKFVTIDLQTKEAIEPFVVRPFFMLVSVDGPLLRRFRRAQQFTPSLILEEFIGEHDRQVYESDPLTSPQSKFSFHDQPSLPALDPLVNLRILNSFDSISDLHAHLDSLDLLSPERLRPGWDSYFMQLATLASHRSNCMKRRVGAILVRNKRIVATGYNGTPRGVTNCNEGGCARCNSGNEVVDECLCLHAEENALLEAGRERVGDGAVLYCNTCPCLKCTIKIIQTGVKEVVYNLSYKVDDASAGLFSEAGVKLRRHAIP